MTFLPSSSLSINSNASLYSLISRCVKPVSSLAILEKLSKSENDKKLIIFKLLQ